MPVPAFYSEASLAAFMVVELGTVADALGWVPGTPRVEYAVQDVAVVLGVADVATVTDIASLRALARLEIWRAARAGLVDRYRVSIDGQALDRQQMFEHVTAMLAEAEQQAAAVGVGTAVLSINPITRTEDPYGVLASGTEF